MENRKNDDICEGINVDRVRGTLMSTVREGRHDRRGMEIRRRRDP